MDILNLEINSVALSTSYEGDTDLKFVSYHDISEEGLNFYREEHLSNLPDRKINNYSSLYLTRKQKLDNFLYIEELPKLNQIEIFNTSIKYIDGSYITLSSNGDFYLNHYFTKKDQKFIDETDRTLEISLLNEFDAKITHKSKNRNLYTLITEGSSFKFCLTSNNDNSIFKYILDRENNTLAFFKKDEFGLSSVNISNNSLVLNPDITSFTEKNFIVNYYIQNLLPKINTSWVSYNLFHKNSYEINPEKSRLNLENNYLISTQYSYVTGDTLKSNIITLKNQNTHKNYNYRSDFIEITNDEIPPVDNREYFGLHTGNDQERGDYGITLSYEFYNSDYRFNADSYTTFITPKSLYPYTQININDLRWDKMGSIGGENPYVSDRIYQKLISENGGEVEYLCSWLYKNKNNEFVWLDRYYYPIKTSYAAALSTSFNYSFEDPNLKLFIQALSANEYYDVPFPYNSLEEEATVTPETIKSAIYGRSFYDKRSDVVILPNKEYIYYRVGDNYVKDVIKTIEDTLIQNGFDARNSNNSTIAIYVSASDVDELEYHLNNDTYGLTENYKNINTSHEFTICFWMKSEDWSVKNGYEIVGNLNQKGFGVFQDRKITPLITIQSENNVFVYNTDFITLDIASLDSEFEGVETKPKIKDIYRTDHLDQFYTINIS